MKIWPGHPYPLGATFDGMGANFAVFSEVARRVELCLFDEHGHETRVDLPERTSWCWHGYVPGLQPGLRYGFRVHGPWAPHEGHRCDPSKLLLDPYAKAVTGAVRWDEAVFSYAFAAPDGPPPGRDSGPFMPKSVVINPFFDWGSDRHPHTPWHNTVIYEVHVAGLTKRHPRIPPELRGTYAGLAHPVMLDYLSRLGVTAVELLPVHQFVHDWHLEQKGLRNYWGYNSIAYLAPHCEYASAGQLGQQVQEFKQMVKALHEAGIEVILDVVYNHTAEGNHMGPTLSLKGIDNAAYYRLVAGDRRYYMDYTGTGNSLNVRHPQVLQLIMDSLRYWVTEMHVDGFRFDLASTLARELHDVDRLSAFFDLIHQDPIVSQVKLIAEPWDVGAGGYQVGNFPPQWSEWNGKYRDLVRDYWRGSAPGLSELAYRLTGSSDLYGTTGRTPFASINFITAHDGFTLRDLVSYNEKHNEANGEGNRDGESHNRSWNCGAEGPTADPEVEALRARQVRNLLTTLFLSQGVPMLLGGDELGRTQEGNNNAYCQDNPVSWYDWERADHDLVAFVASLARLRREHPVFRRRRFFLGRPIMGAGIEDLVWFRPDGVQMADGDWGVAHARALGVFLNGDAITGTDVRGEPLKDDSFYLLLNAHHEALPFVVPGELAGWRWTKVLDTLEASPVRVPPREALRALLPPDEDERLRELHALQILDTPPEQVFDDFAQLASQLCGTPIALVTLVDEDRQWFKARVGLDVSETSREVSFCGHAILHEELMEVPDAARDPRFAANPLVTGEPRIRFYAGQPLTTSAGHALGTLCVIDREPRTLTDGQRAALHILSRQVVAQLEARRQMQELVGRLTRQMGADGNGATRRVLAERDGAPLQPGQELVVGARSLVLLRGSRG